MCTLCGGELMLLGQLGRLVHVTCRNCGMQFSHEADELDLEADDEAA